MSSLDATRREAHLDDLHDRHFDLIVIGGGISGAGVAAEASARGLSVALVEARDFASGTSSRSSKLIHGGLRYLAMGDVALVRETALERKVLHELAPHLAQPRWMLLPVRSRAGLLKFRTVLASYEKLGAVADADRHCNWDAGDLAQGEPLLDRTRYPFACVYREYLTDDARLVIANLRAAAARGATIASHLPVRAMIRDENGRALGVEVRCALSGRAVRVRGRSVVNAAGPWVDEVQGLAERGDEQRLHLSKGVHVCFPARKFPVRNLLLLAAADRRTIFAIPRGRVTYVGTTDSGDSGGARTWPQVDDADVRYLIEPLRRYCPAVELAAADVVFAWAGLRPLIAQGGRAPKDLSRKDEIRVGTSGVIAVAGGKLTGYRPMARRVMEEVERVLGQTTPAPAVETLPGGALTKSMSAAAADVARSSNTSDEVAERLVGLYGSEAAEVAALGSAVLADAPVVRGEIEWAVRREGALRLEDFIYRRARAALYEPEQAAAVLTPAAERMAEMLDWSEERRRAEIERTRERLRCDGA